MRTLLATILLALAGVTAAQDSTAVASRHAWFVGAELDFYFDNLEAKGSAIDCSGTLFSARLTPYVGWQWNETCALNFGVDMRRDFGDSVSFLTDAKPLFYYSYRGKLWEANAGIFHQHLLKGEYNDMIHNGGYFYENNQIMGISGTYTGKKGMWEAAINWDGMYSDRCRERFRIYSAGRYDVASHFHIGYGAQMTHLALSARGLPDEGVVDNILFAPYIGTTFDAFFDWTIRGHMFVGYQRDRIVCEKHMPVGAQLDIALSKWGFRLHNELYLGQNQLPFYNKYGTLLYTGNENYGTRKHIYNHTGLDYNRSLFHDVMEVGASFEAHYDGTSVAVQQVVTLKVNLCKIWN